MAYSYCKNSPDDSNYGPHLHKKVIYAHTFVLYSQLTEHRAYNIEFNESWIFSTAFWRQRMKSVGFLNNTIYYMFILIFVKILY